MVSSVRALGYRVFVLVPCGVMACGSPDRCDGEPLPVTRKVSLCAVDVQCEVIEASDFRRLEVTRG